MFKRFISPDALTNHKICCDLQDALRVELPEPGAILKFEKYYKSMRVPFVIYADFESCIKPIDTCIPVQNTSYTNKYQKHVPISFCIYVKCSDDTVYPPRTETYTAENEDDDVGQIFVYKLEEIVKQIYRVIKEKENRFKHIENMIYTEKDKKSFESATVCHICGYNLRKKRGDKIIEDQVRDHCHG